MFDTKFTENNTLLFYAGLVYTCTNNDSIKINTQKCILFHLTDQEPLNRF